jgi:excisionase family DNA binding protein
MEDERENVSDYTPLLPIAERCGNIGAGGSMNQLMEEWVTPKDAAAYLGISVKTVRGWCVSGRLISRKLGYRTIRIATVSIEKMLERKD